MIALATLPSTTANDEVRLNVDGRSLGGWTDIAITCRAEGLPNSFEVGLTSTDPASGGQTLARAGDECVVKIGRDTVITGYIDRDINSGSANGHELRIVGRGKCADLVDCSAEWPGGQIIGSNTKEVAEKLAKPYGITVLLAPGADVGPAVPQLNLNYGETAYSIIERLTRAAGLLAYEDAHGRLILAQVGKVQAASGFKYGENVQAWSTTIAQDGRFSEIISERVSVDILGSIGEGGNVGYSAPDPNVKRHRLLYIVQEASGGAETPDQLGQRKVIWEQARRAGRGTQVRITADSWRDSAGKLWEPNTLVPVKVPGLAPSGPMIISEVTYRRDSDSGTTCDVMLMPPAAFTPEPTVLVPVNLQGIRGASE